MHNTHLTVLVMMHKANVIISKDRWEIVFRWQWN